MSPKVITEYMERKAVENPAIAHLSTDDEQSFFVIDDPYDLTEFDNALRNVAKFPAMLMELNDGNLDDSNSASFTDTVHIAFMIVDKIGDDERIRDVRFRCYDIGKKIIGAILKDARNNEIIADKIVSCPLHSNYVPVGPMDSQYYGYQFTLEFVGSIGFCP